MEKDFLKRASLKYFGNDDYQKNFIKGQGEVLPVDEEAPTANFVRTANCINNLFYFINEVTKTDKKVDSMHESAVIILSALANKEKYLLLRMPRTNELDLCLHLFTAWNNLQGYHVNSDFANGVITYPDYLSISNPEEHSNNETVEILWNVNDEAVIDKVKKFVADGDKKKVILYETPLNDHSDLFPTKESKELALTSLQLGKTFKDIANDCTNNTGNILAYLKYHFGTLEE